MNHTREQVYEYLRHLDYYSIRNLCQSDRYYHGLCRVEMFDKLISEKYQETTEYKVKQLEREIQGFDGYDFRRFNFEPTHFIYIYNNRINEFYYQLSGGYRNTLLFKLLDQETGFSRLSPQDLVNYARMLKQEGKYIPVDKLNPYGPSILLKYWIEDHNVNYDTDIRGERLTIKNPTSQQLREVLTMILENESAKEF